MRNETIIAQLDGIESIWQFLTKEHMEENVGEPISDADWRAFRNKFLVRLADEYTTQAILAFESMREVAA